MPTSQTGLYQYRGTEYYPTVTVDVIEKRPTSEGGDRTIYKSLVALYSETDEKEASSFGEPGLKKVSHFTFQQLPLPNITPAYTIVSSGVEYDVEEVLINNTRSTPVRHCRCTKVRYPSAG